MYYDYEFEIGKMQSEIPCNAAAPYGMYWLIRCIILYFASWKITNASLCQKSESFHYLECDAQRWSSSELARCEPIACFLTTCPSWTTPQYYSLNVDVLRAVEVLRSGVRPHGGVVLPQGGNGDSLVRLRIRGGLHHAWDALPRRWEEDYSTQQY